MSFAPIQLLRTEITDVWSFLDNQIDKYICGAFYFGATSTLPTAPKFAKGCILVHPADDAIYLNINAGGIAPSWYLLNAYSVFQEDGVAFPQRAIANFTHGLDLTDDAMNGATIIAVDEGELDLALMGGLLDLATQTTGTLPTNTTAFYSTVSSATSGLVQVPSLTWSHTTVGSDRLLTVEIETEQVTSITGVTYNGIALTQDAVQSTNVTGNIRNEMWYLVNPPLGTYNIVVSVSPNAYITAGAKGWNSVDTAVIFDGSAQAASGNSTNPSDIFTSTIQNVVVNPVIGTAVLPTTHTPDTGQTTAWSITTAATRQGTSTSEVVNTPAATTVGFTLAPSQQWAMLTYGVVGLSTVPAGLFDRYVKVSAADTTSDYLNPKISAGTGIATTILNPGGNEQLEISVIPSTVPTTTVGIPVTQTAHGLSVGDVIKSSGTDGEYALAQADSAVNAEVVGIVVTVGGVNDFEYAKDILGITGAFVPAGTAGEAVFLDPTTPGAMTTTAPTTSGQVVKPIGVLTDNAGGVMDFSASIRGELLTTTTSGTSQSAFEQSNSSTIIVNNVTLFDDFTNTELVDDGSPYNVSGNFAFDSNTVSSTELNHPGIISKNVVSGRSITGFSAQESTVAGNPGLMTFNNDFDIQLLSRLVYSGPSWTAQYNLMGGTDQINVEISNSQVTYNIGGGVVVTGVSVPASNTWFTLRFQYVSGTLTITLNASTIVSTAVSLADEFYVSATPVLIGGGSTLAQQLDYCIANYTVTR